MIWRRPTVEERQAQRAAEREANLRALCKPTKALHRGVYAPVSERVTADPKTEPKRCPALLELAKDMPCLLAIDGICLGHDSRTSVACHSNRAKHGKAGARKADDHYSVWGCAACHRWLDQPIGHFGPTLEEKQAAFDLAHEAQRAAWASIANGPQAAMLYTEKQRKAAQWALDQLKAEVA